MNRLFLLLFGAVSLVAHAQVPDYVPTEGLVAWYPFNGNANDESGKGNDGDIGWASWPVLSAGYRYVSPGPARGIFKVGIGTVWVYVGFGWVLR